jgi:hypothetical protein
LLISSGIKGLQETEVPKQRTTLRRKSVIGPPFGYDFGREDGADVNIKEVGKEVDK